MSDEQTGNAEPSSAPASRPEPAPAAESGAARPVEPIPLVEDPKGERPSLLEGFDEDEDFDTPEKPKRAPELPRSVKPMPWERPADEAKDRPDLLRSHVGGWKLWAGIGGSLVVAAAILTAIRLGGQGFLPALTGVLLVFYNAIIHSVTGTASVYAAAWTGGRRVASIERAAARMAAAVGALLAAQSVEVGLLDSRLEEVAIGGVAYLAVIGSAFRLDRHTLLVLAGTHAGLWTILYVGHALSESVGARPLP